MNTDLYWDEQRNVWCSSRFEDVYFSAQGPEEETHYVFVEHNGLPRRWRDLELGFVVCELGFGTGANFQHTLNVWRKCAPEKGTLIYTAFERYPLSAHQLREVWSDKPPCWIEDYPPLLEGLHLIDIQEDIKLFLILDDVNTALPQMDYQVDAWYLDGFAPARNPDMWSPVVFEEMARCSKPGTTFATYTAAGAVKRGLEAVGFSVDKEKGFGTKRHMLCGTYQGVSP